MKTIPILITVLLLHAFTVDKETAKTVAVNFMNNKSSITNVVVKNIIKEESRGQKAIYIVNFQSGGWVMVSSYKSAIPVLSFSFTGEYKTEDEKPEAFISLTNSYKEQVISSKNIKSIDPEIDNQWKKLINGDVDNPKSLQGYTPGTHLLNVPGRGHVEWRQSINNSGTCTPSYNAFCPTDNDCSCNKKPVGCGAVAMGQIMWYWQWPQSSSYRTYNWDLMPSILFHGTNQQEADEVAHLLRDCGRASDMNYGFLGLGCFSWTTTDKIEDAFKNTFNYEGVRRTLRSHWEDSDVWCDLMRSEIDNGRPVLYRGDEKVVATTSRHYFVLDGYDVEDPDYFSFNFGWGGSSHNISYHYLNDISPGSNEYNKNQRAVVGISPTYYTPEDQNIYAVSYSNVFDVKKEDARYNIALPESGDALIVESGGDLTLTAGESITLNPGFHAKTGSKFAAKINSDYKKEMDIIVQNWWTGFTPNQELCYQVQNANSWEFTAVDGNDNLIFQSAGSISGNNVCVWDGSGAYPWSASYRCIVRLKNSYGRYEEKDYWVFYSTGQLKQESFLFDSHTFGIDEAKEQ